MHIYPYEPIEGVTIDEREKSLRLLRASLVGDANIVGVCAILKRLRKHKKRGYRKMDELQPFDIVQDAMMNGESMMSTLRKRAMEGLGEVIESVEDKAIQQGRSFGHLSSPGPSYTPSNYPSSILYNPFSYPSSIPSPPPSVKNTLQTFKSKIGSYFKIAEGKGVDKVMEFEKLVQDAVEERKKKKKTTTVRFLTTVRKEEEEAAKAASAVKQKATGMASGTVQTADEELKILEDRLTKATSSPHLTLP